MKSSLQKRLLAAGLIGTLAFGASQVLASPYFKYDAAGLSGAGTVFNANSAAGTSSEHLFVSSPTTFAGAGWAQFTSLNDQSAALLGSGYGVTGLYATFTLSLTYQAFSPGGFGLNNSFYSVDSFTFNLYRDAGAANTFTQANATAGTLATVQNAGTDILLGSGTLVSAGSAGIINGTGTFLNVSTDFALNAIGQTYFFDPLPFYNLALAGFTSTGGAWLFNAGTGMASVGNAGGVVDFRNSVPEPGTLALVGIALLGLAARSRRSKQ